MNQYGSCFLYKFYYLFKIASFFGVFPGYFDENGELKVRIRWALHLRGLIFTVVFMVGSWMGIWYFVTQSPEGTTFGDYFVWYSTPNKRFLDAVTFTVPPLVGVFSGIFQNCLSAVAIKPELELDQVFREQLPKSGYKRLMPVYRNIFW